MKNTYISAKFRDFQCSKMRNAWRYIKNRNICAVTSWQEHFPQFSASSRPFSARNSQKTAENSVKMSKMEHHIKILKIHNSRTTKAKLMKLCTSTSYKGSLLLQKYFGRNGHGGSGRNRKTFQKSFFIKEKELYLEIIASLGIFNQSK